MRLAKLTSMYPDYLNRFYLERPALADKPYAEQSEALFHDAFGWGDAWKDSLGPLGYEVMEVAANADAMQRAWARENLPRALAGSDLQTIAVEQVRKFAPKVIWFEDPDASLMHRIRENVPGVKLMLGWAGSALPEVSAFRHCDLVLSCSQESVDRLTAKGYRAVQLHHAFDPRILSRLPAAGASHELIFIGQLIRAAQFHTTRERLLEELVERLPLQIFSPQVRPSTGRSFTHVLKRGMRAAYAVTRAIGMKAAAQRALLAIGKDEQWLQGEEDPVSPRLRPRTRQALYGLRMYQAIRDAKATLNIHADSSSSHASNMRLFEVTGVGGCLLTDWKENLPELFKADEEVVAYRSAAECVEKAIWLLGNAAGRAAIARAGQARTLRDHTFPRRAERLHQIIRGAC